MCFHVGRPLSRGEIESLIRKVKEKIKRKQVELDVLLTNLRELELMYTFLFAQNFEVIKQNGTIRFTR